MTNGFRNAQEPDDQLEPMAGSSGALTLAAKEKLKQLVHAIETIEEEQKELAGVKRDKFAEAKAMGYDTKALRTVIRERKQDAQERKEQEMLNDVYRLALDMDD